MKEQKNTQINQNKSFSLYTEVHKGIRGRLYGISNEAGKINASDEVRVDAFGVEFTALAASVRLHHHLEEKFIHPLISDRVPGGTLRLEEEHRVVDQMLTNLQSHFQNSRSKQPDFEKRGELGLEFYLAYNRFIAYFLNHINWEEEQTQRALWDLCTNDELVATFGKILTAQTPEQSLDNFKMILPSVTLDELTGILMGAKASVPGEAFKAMSGLAQGVVSPGDWSVLKDRVGL